MPISARDVKRFERRIRELQQSANALSNEARVEVLKRVDERRRRIKELMDHYPGKSPLPTGDVPRLSQQIRAEVNGMIEDVVPVIKAAQEGAWAKGLAAGRELAVTLELEGVFFAPTPNLVSLATGYTADLVRSIPAELMPKVNGALSRAVLGGLSPYETMQELDKLIGRNAEHGVSYQAERIVRTEVQRVYSIALDTQMQALAARVDSPKKLMKEWVAGPYRPGRREEHQAINGQRVPMDEPFVLPDGTRLMYPRDPGGPPEHTINCGCGWRIAPDSIMDAMM